MTTALKPEFSRPIAVDGISPDKTRTEMIEATEEECAALAARLDLRALSDFKANLKIRRIAGGEVISIAGDFEAEVVQACVVTLSDVHAPVAGSFETFFTEDAAKAVDPDSYSPDDDPDAPEMVSNGQIDMGEVVAQYLSLELDPYPRAPGVSLAAQMAEAGLDTPNNPFQALKALKDGGGEPKTATGKGARKKR